MREYWTLAAPQANILSPAHNFGLVTNICPVTINNKLYIITTVKELLSNCLWIRRFFMKSCFLQCPLISNGSNTDPKSITSDTKSITCNAGQIQCNASFLACGIQMHGWKKPTPALLHPKNCLLNA